jgi:hypothetical protein
MTATSKPQRLYLSWLKGHFRWQQRLALIEWSTDDVISLHAVEYKPSETHRLLFSIPARELIRVTFTIGYLRMFLPDGRTFHVGLGGSYPARLDGEELDTFTDRAKASGVGDEAWWRQQFEAAGVPATYRGGKWFAAVVVAATVAIVAAALILVLAVGA